MIDDIFSTGGNLIERDLMDRIEELTFDLSQLQAERDRLKVENARLMDKLHRQKQSIVGQEKLWLQTKVSLLEKIVYLQGVNDDYVDKIRSLERDVLDATAEYKINMTPVPNMKDVLERALNTIREHQPGGGV